MEWDPAQRKASENYHFLTSAVMPRPVAWITTVDPATGVVNAAPFSWFNSVCAEPPMVMTAIQSRSPGVPKDTVRNIRASGEYVVNLATVEMAQRMVETSANYPPDFSEVEALGLATDASAAVRPPRLRDSPVHLECRLEREIRLGTHGDVSLLLGTVVHIHVRDDVLDARGNLDAAKVTLVGRMGGDHYVDTAAFFSLARPSSPDGLRP